MHCCHIYTGTPCGVQTFDEFIQLAMKGRRQNVDQFTGDMLPEHVDGDEFYEKLSDNAAVAFSFGKATDSKQPAGWNLSPSLEIRFASFCQSSWYYAQRRVKRW